MKIKAFIFSECELLRQLFQKYLFCLGIYFTYIYFSLIYRIVLLVVTNTDLYCIIYFIGLNVIDEN